MGPNANESAAYASTSNSAALYSGATYAVPLDGNLPSKALYGGDGSREPSAYAAPFDGNLPSNALYGGGGCGGRGLGDNSDEGYEMPNGFPQSNAAPMYSIPFETGEEVAYIATGSVA